MSSQIKQAILQAFERPLIPSTSIMANVAGFEEACELVRHTACRSNRPASEPDQRGALECPAPRSAPAFVTQTVAGGQHTQGPLCLSLYRI